MALARTIKKTVYAVCMAAVLFVIVGLLALPFISQRDVDPVQPTQSPFLAIEVQRVAAIPQGDVFAQNRTVDLVAELRNPNPRAGAMDYTISFEIEGVQGQSLAQAEATTFLLPGSLHYAIALNVPLPAGEALGQVNVTKPSDVQFIEVPVSLDLPQFSVSLQGLTERGEGPSPRIQSQLGLVRNTGTLDWQRVGVSAVALDDAGDIIAAGTTFVGALTVGEQREFTIQWPKTPIPIRNIIALPSTNIFEEENVIRVIGDPSTLR